MLDINPGVALIAWAVVGLLAGGLAGLLFRGSGFGVLADLLIGLAGAMGGGFILSLAEIAGPARLVSGVILAFLGAVILLWLIRVLSGRTRKTAL